MDQDTDRVMTTAEIVELYRHGKRDFHGLDIQDSDGQIKAFRGAVLNEADFGGAWVEADFTNATLRGAVFRNANVKCCTFDGADLSHTDFSNSAIDAATFEGAKFDGSNFTGAGAYGVSLAEGEFPIG